jgi:hypothetical protein
VIRTSNDERGSVLLTALLSTLVMLALGLALLAIVDVQANESGTERTRDQAFNLSEAALTNEAFVLGRNWPGSAASAPVVPGTVTACGDDALAFGSTLGTTLPAGSAAAVLQSNLNAAYTDAAYAGATWALTVCDDDGTNTAWSDTLLANVNWDQNHNDKVWVRARATVGGRPRTLVALVQGLKSEALDARYGLVAGGMGDDLGATVNALTTNDGVLGSVLSSLLNTTPTVTGDPAPPAGTEKSGVTGIRCGLADLKASATGLQLCTAGTIAALGAIPLAQTLLVGSEVEQFPSLLASTNAIGQLRDQAKASGTYTAVSDGAAPTTRATLLNGTKDGVPASVPACTITGTPNKNTVVFIEQVGAGTGNVRGGPGDQYCAIDVSTPKSWKALVIASGRVVLRGDGTPRAPRDVPDPLPAATDASYPRNMFRGVVYALNLQRLPVAQGGRGLGDSSTVGSPGREVVRIDEGAHVRGSVVTDGKSGVVGVYPPDLTIDNYRLIDDLVPCKGILSCATNGTLKLLNGVGSLVNGLLDALGLSAVGDLVDGLTGQLTPQREAYGSAITADVRAIREVKVLSASAIVPGTFRDLAAR